MEKYKTSQFSFETNEPVIEVEISGDESKAFPLVKNDKLNQITKAIRHLIESVDYKHICECDDEQYIMFIYSILDAIDTSYAYERGGIIEDVPKMQYVKWIVNDIMENKLYEKKRYEGVFHPMDEDD